MSKTYTIQELVDAANKQIKTSPSEFSSQDGRYSSELTVRRVRDYISKGILEKANKKSGKFDIYEEYHLEKLLNIRKLQQKGFGDRTISTSLNNLYSQSNNLLTSPSNLCQEGNFLNEPQKNKALNIIEELQNETNKKENTPLAYQSVNRSLGEQQNQKVISYNINTKNSSNIFEEHEISNDIKLSIKDGAKYEINEVMKKIENILKNKGE